MTSFLVTTSALGSIKTQLWNPSHPLALGHPFRWVIEKTHSGLRIIDVARTDSGIQKLKLKMLTEAELTHGAEIQLGEKNPISLKIRAVNRLAPAFENKSGPAVTIYACSGSWVLSSTPLQDSRTPYFGVIGGKKYFQLNRIHAEQYELRALNSSDSSISLLVDGHPARLLRESENITLTHDQIKNASIVAGNHRWCLGLSNEPSLPISSGIKQKDPDQAAFNSALRFAAIGLTALIALSWIWPKPKVETQEIIPAQYAKIILSKPKTQASASSGEAPKAAVTPTEKVASNTALPKKVQDTAVVQAFRAQALSHAVNGLLKGGMSKLMAQSDFVAGSNASQQARRIFDTQSKALSASGPQTGGATTRSVQVASLGGAGLGGSAGVGYGKGQHAAVQGQGGSFVTMDTSGSVVEEGLTKDEVGEVIHRHMSEVRYCYESAMIRTPDLQGKLMVSFTIGGSGAVKSSEVKSSTLPDPRLDDCILRRLTTWKFPQPRGGIDVSVTYPFIFKTLGR